MYLKHKLSGDMVEVLDLPVLFDPFQPQVRGRFHAGEELQEADLFPKAELLFPSGESLSRCWVDRGYRS